MAERTPHDFISHTTLTIQNIMKVGKTMIFLGEDMSIYSDDFVMFAENTIAGITNQKLNSIFIKPTFVN